MPEDGQNMTETCSMHYYIKYNKIFVLSEIYNLPSVK